MTLAELEALAHNQMAMARDHLRETGAWRPVAIVVGRDGTISIFDFADALDRRGYIAAHICGIAKDEAAAVLLVGDTWMGKFPSGMTQAEADAERERLPPSIEDWPAERRAEALTVSAFSPEAAVGLAWVYERQGDQIVGGEVEKARAINSRWNPWSDTT